MYKLIIGYDSPNVLQALFLTPVHHLLEVFVRWTFVAEHALLHHLPLLNAGGVHVETRAIEGHETTPSTALLAVDVLTHCDKHIVISIIVTLTCRNITTV